MLLSTPALAAVLWPKRRQMAGQAPALLGVLLLGLTPYLWMVYRSQASEISLAGPIGNWSEFWDYVRRRGYASVDQSVTAGWLDKLRFAGFALRETTGQFGPLAGPLMAWGVIRQAREWPLHVWLALALLFLGSTFVLASLLGFDYDLVNRNAFLVYPLTAYVAAILWTVLGLKALDEWLSARSGATVRRGLVRYGAAVLLVLSIWMSNASSNLRARDTWAEDYAAATLMTLPPQSIFFMFGEQVAGPVGYLNRIEGLRPDITLMSVNGMLFSNRLFQPGSWTLEGARPVIEKFITDTDRPIHYFPFLPQRFGSVFGGLHFGIVRDGPPNLRRFAADRPVMEFFERMFVHGEPRDTSQLIHFRYLTGWYCHLAAGIVEHATGRAAGSEFSSRLESRCSGYYGLLRRAEAMLAKEKPDVVAIRDLLRRAERRSDEAAQVRDLATLYYLVGKTFQVAGDQRMTELFYLKSLSKFPSPTNPANEYFQTPRRAPGAD
ncbi:MAG: hypothetical protein HYY48_05770 [Gammaproteobacteria bacterium]|nr:hypothetical protein [Gammaproteobacteria bacterium]